MPRWEPVPHRTEPGHPRTPAWGPTVDEMVCAGIADAASATALEEAFEAGFEAFAREATTDPAREGVAAFIEKRKPDLRGGSAAD